jgi:hypothetical protein
MNWTDVAKIIAPIAPAAGSILGGLIPFPGASFIGEQLGKGIARQFGVPETPQAVAQAISGSPNEVAIAKINQAVALARTEVEGFAEIEKAYVHAAEVSTAEVGATMRAEIGHEHWYFNGWRPASGWVFVFQAFVFGCILMVAGARSAFFESPQSLERLTAAWPIYAAYFGSLAAMVGVYIIGRSMDKGKAIESGVAATPTKPGSTKPATLTRK